MIAAIDVQYSENGSATAGAVVFGDYYDSEAYQIYRCCLPRTEPYVPGQFYKRELPCIVAILGMINEDLDTLIIDGYVDLGEKPGLGRHLWKALDCNKKVIGVAKTSYLRSDAIEVFRGKSVQPLYITSAGIEPSQAAVLIKNMHGKNRIPTLLKLADSLCRLSDKKKLGNIMISGH
jgi:deoxyribonuclease V